MTYTNTTKMTLYIRIMALVSFMLVLTTTMSVQANVLVPLNNENTRVMPSSSSSYIAGGRYLQEERQEITKEDEQDIGSAVEKVMDDHSSNNNDNKSDEKDNQYVPHEVGTAVQFQDQDGTWMSGIIDDFKIDTRTYVIKWDEGYEKEAFSDLEKVDQLVINAENKDAASVSARLEDITEKGDDHSDGDEGYDWNNDVEDEDESARLGDSTENDSKNTDKSSSSSSSSYQGTIPENFNSEYTYKYENLSEYEAWPVDTVTLLEFQDGYYEGKITSFNLSDDKKTATYFVRWSDGTTDTFVNELEWMDLMVENAIEYKPWEVGTKSYGYPNPEAGSNEPFLGGEITLFEDGAYNVTWSNGDVVMYNDFDMVDALVNNAGMHYEPSLMDNYEPWPYGTPVAWDFDDGWWDGTITDFTDGNYEVTWSDESTKIYSNLEKIDQMVQYVGEDGGDFQEGYDDQNGGYDDFQGDYQYYPIGTIVYAEFEDGWWAGHIDSYDEDYYIVQWSDNTIDNFLPGPDVDAMVENSQLIPFDESGIYPIGSQVYKEFEDGWFWGSIESNAGGLYTVIWDDGERTNHVSGLEMNKMVANATGGQGMSDVGKVFLSLFVLGSVAAILFFFVRRSNKRKKLADVTEQVQENELDLAEGNGLVANEGESNTIEYTDKTDEDTKPAVI